MPNQPQPITPQQSQNFVIFKIDNVKVNIDVFFEEKELDGKVVCRDFRHTTQHGAIEGKIQENEIELFENQVLSKIETTCKDILQVQRIV